MVKNMVPKDKKDWAIFNYCIVGEWMYNLGTIVYWLNMPEHEF